MAKTESKRIPIGWKAPNFQLWDPLAQKNISLTEIVKPNGVAVVFICNHCPYVIHILEKLTSVLNDCLAKNIGAVAISSNDETQYPEDAPEKMAVMATKMNFLFPYLYDQSQETAIAYNATCTPDLFLFDHQQKLYYHGQFDSARPGNKIIVSGADFLGGIENMLAGKKPPPLKEQKASLGCNIKWKK